MADLNDLIEDSNAKLSRRNVVVGTAWAVPAIMAVGAAPAMAASRIVNATATLVSRDFKLEVTTSGAGTGDVVRIISISGPTTLLWGGGPNNPIARDVPIAANVATVLGKRDQNPAPAAGTYTVTYTVTGISGNQTTTFMV